MGALGIRRSVFDPSFARGGLKMAMTAYTGVQGSGKTFEVVANVIIPSLAAGRRVVTNVAGLQSDAIADYIQRTKSVPVTEQGVIVAVANDDVTRDNFFPLEGGAKHSGKIYVDDAGNEVTDLTLARSSRVVDVDSIVQPGDVVIIDECWRWYGVGEQLLPAHMAFFRMHRHFLHPVTAVSCDIVFVVQDIGDIQRKVKATIEKIFWMKKHKDLWLSNRYVVNVYSGNALRASQLSESLQKSYDPDIFPLYSSYSQSSQAVGRELQVDNRGNLLNRKIFKLAIPIGLIWLGFAVWFIWGFFHPEKKSDVPQSQSQSGAVKTPALPPEASIMWRLIGFYETSSGVVYILSDGRVVRRVANPPAVKLSAAGVEIALPNGDIVTSWSGRFDKSPTTGGVQ